MRISFPRVIFLSSALVALAAIIVAILFFSPHRAASLTSTPITGYAWSDTIGWISMSGSNYGLSMDSSGTVTGYAWSDNIGWVEFGGLSSFPSGTGTTAANAQIVAGQLTGWARACAGTASGNCSTMTSRTDGWDGWISLAGTNYGVSYNSGTGLFSGYAWGSMNVGAVDFSQVYAAPQCSAQASYCVNSTTIATWNASPSCSFTDTQCATNICSDGSCVANAPSGKISADPSIVSQNKAVVIRWTASNIQNGCSVTGTNGDGSPPPVAAWSSPVVSGGNSGGSQTSSLINKQTTYTLTCDSTVIGTVTVSVVPTFREI